MLSCVSGPDREYGNLLADESIHTGMRPATLASTARPGAQQHYSTDTREDVIINGWKPGTMRQVLGIQKSMTLSRFQRVETRDSAVMLSVVQGTK